MDQSRVFRCHNAWVAASLVRPRPPSRRRRASPRRALLSCRSVVDSFAVEELRFPVLARRRSPSFHLPLNHHPV